MNGNHYPGIDYDWRPESYWAESDSVLKAALRNVKGANRRKMIRDYDAAGMLEELHPVYLQQALTSDQRKRLGRLHPSFMGGEYLPDYAGGEVEIARIELNSTLSDVTSIRARPAQNGRIAYSIVDEYESGFAFSPEESKVPLSLGELIDLIDGARPGSEDDCYEKGLALRFNQANLEAGEDATNLRHFTTVISDIYTGLFAHYDKVHAEWVVESDEDYQDFLEGLGQSVKAGLEEQIRLQREAEDESKRDRDAGALGKSEKPEEMSREHRGSSAE